MNIGSYKMISYLRKYRLIIVTSLILLLALFFLLAQKKTVTNETPVRLVRIFTIGSQYSRQTSYTGSVHARVESDLGFRVGGKIIEKAVDRGQHVKKNQPLMRLDPVDLALTEKATQQEVDAAKAEYERAKPDAARLKILFAEHAVSRQEYERGISAAIASLARLNAAKAQASQASNQLAYAVLYADGDGVVTDVLADVGQVITPGQVVVRLARDGTREAVINLPENAVQIAKDASYAYLYTNPEQKFQVRLRELSAMADTVTRTYQARYTLLGEGQKAPLGATVTVAFKPANSNKSQSYNVPIGALYDTGQGTNVWVISNTDSTVSLRAVKILHLGEEYASISGNIQPGEHIVALGAHLLKPGEEVRVNQNPGDEAL